MAKFPARFPKVPPPSFFFIYWAALDFSFMEVILHDVLILGAGISGLSAALHAAENGLSVLILTKGAKPDGSSNYAQGGIASVTAKTDSFELHISDTDEAGAGLCKKRPVEILTRSGPKTIDQLVKWGVKFTPAAPNEDNLKFDLHLEGGHSHKRILHSADLTGKEIMRALLAQLKHVKAIDYLENAYVYDLICQGEGKEKRCLGARIVRQKTGEVESVFARSTILSTGGAGRIWCYTVCPQDSTGDGIAIAGRAGASLQDLEFMQFHPTSLYAPKLRKPFLISEAVRGYGAVLKNKAGERFMDGVHPLGSLAPRDIVARAIHAEMERTGEPCMYLDVTAHNAKDTKAHFPNINAKCEEVGIDMTKDWIPVVPAAHYMCGGVLVDTESRSDIRGLYACGEVAATGVHGANRLASNSLLESVVFAIRAVDDILKADLPDFKKPASKKEVVDLKGGAEWKRKRSALQKAMWRYCGIVRSTAGLEKGLALARKAEAEMAEAMKTKPRSLKLLEFRNAVQTSRLILESALLRKESRGLHCTTDYPEPAKKTEHHTVHL